MHSLIERCSTLDQPGWLDFRLALWPDATADEHRGYMAISLAQPERFLQLMIYDEQKQPIGFIEGSIRNDYVNGTETSPVGFVEGVYVTPAWRRRGIARRLFAAIGDWARARGCRELASDALLENGARLVRDVAAARRAADERGQRLLTFSVEAEVGFEQPSDLERFADALADRIAELAAEFGPGRRRYRVIVGGHPA